MTKNKCPLILCAYSLLLGVVASYATAPTSIWPLMIIGLSGIYYITWKSTKSWHTFINGWLFGFGYFVSSLSWIGNALLVEGNEFVWAWPLAVSGLPAMLAFFPASACYISKKTSKDNKLLFLPIFIVCLSLSEWLRGHLFTGFPWNLFGYAWGAQLEILQILALSNVYFLTSLTIFWAACLAHIFCVTYKSHKIIFFSATTISFLLVFTYGHHRLTVNNEKNTHEKVQIKIIQANIPQHKKWKPEELVNNFNIHLNLSRPNKNDKEESIIIIWPETATSHLFLNNKFYRSQISTMLQQYDGEAELVTGALLKDKQTLSNSIVTVKKSGNIDQQYNKSHLVPFGEYIPFQNILPIKTVTGFNGFTPGHGLKSITTLEKLKFSPLVCYEILFPGNVIPKNKDIDFIINVTNDAWYGDSAGPHQHLQKAVFRAVEEGVTVVRAASSGISAVIDPYGRIVKQTNLLQKSVIKSDIPKALKH